MSIAHHLSFTRTAMATLFAATLSVSVVGCGSSSSSSAVPTTTIDGSAFASSVNGASCQVQDINGNVIATGITTSATGEYTAYIPTANLASDLVLTCTGGTYTDEATGTSETAGTLTAYADADSLAAGVNLHATPESTIMHRLRMQHQMTLAEAETAFENAFGYTPDTTIAPTDATGPAAEATDEELLAGLRAAAFSQLTMNLGLTAAEQFELLLALADDLSDGTLDGVDATGPVSAAGSALPADIQNQFNTAMLDFRAGGNDASGLDNSMIGILPFAQTALTSNYTVEYVEGMMDAMEGKNKFQVRVTNNSDSTPATGKAVTLMPMMHMDADKSHATPVDGACIESGTAGTYDCTIYYVMASTMMDGMSMGYWDLKVMVDGMMDTVNFYPTVMMAMNGTALVKQKNENDTVMNMEGGADARTFLLFKSNLSGMTGNHTFELFTSTMETMMSFPAVTSTTTLGAGTGNELIISSMTVEVSTDATFNTGVVSAIENGNGYWTAASIAGLTNDVEGELYVRMVINGLTYNSSIDGVYIDEATTPSYATFTVTPSAPMVM